MATNTVKLEDVISQAKQVLETGNPDFVIALCRYIFKYYPRALEVTRLLGEAYTEKRLLDEADQLFVFVLAADPHDVLGYVDRGFIAYERGSIDEAITYYERAIELDPNIEQLRSELLRLYKERYGSSRAKLRLTKAALANYRLRDGFYNQAINEYNNILNETPERLDIQVWTMEAYWRNRDYGRAEKLALELLHSHPYLIKANLILWHIYGVRRHQDSAATYLEKAHLLDPLNLIAERLFENALLGDDTANYISMMGTAAIPAFESEQVEQESEGQPLIPDWVTNDLETDRRLGLRLDEDAPTMRPGSLTSEASGELTQENDWLSKLLAETEQQTQSQKAQSDLDQLRQGEGDKIVGGLFEEIEEKPLDRTANRGVPSVDRTRISPLDLASDSLTTPPSQANEKPFRADENSLDAFFEELGPTAAENSITVRAVNNSAPDEEAELFSYAPQLKAEDSEVDTPFDPTNLAFESIKSGPLESAAFNPSETEQELADFSWTEKSSIRPDKMVDTGPTSFKSDNFEVEKKPPQLSEKDKVALPAPASKPELRGELDDFFDDAEVDLFAPTMPPPHLRAAEKEDLQQVAAFTLPGLVQESNYGREEYADEFKLATEAAELTLKSVGNRPAEPQEEKAEQNQELEYFKYGSETEISQLTPKTEPAALEHAQVAARAETSLQWESEVGRLEPHAFHQRDERGPAPENIASPARSVDWLPSATSETDITATQPTQSMATPLDYAANITTVSGIEADDKENEAMPIKKGSQDDDSNVFDWEKEELPDYLRDFALDEDEVVRRGQPSNPTIGSDMTTGPAHIRPRDPGAASPGNVPDWLNPGSNRPAAQINMPGASGDPIDLGGGIRPGGTGGPLPPWLDATEERNQPSLGRTPSNSPTDPGMGAFGLDDLKPFSLDGDDGFGSPAIQPPAIPNTPPPSVSRSPSSPSRSSQTVPFQMPSSTDFDMDLGDDIQPFSMEGIDGNSFGQPAMPPPAQSRPANPNLPASRPAPAQPNRPPAPPPVATPFSLNDDMGDISPFGFSDFGETPSVPPPAQARPATPPPPAAQARPAASPPARAPQPPAAAPFSLDDDMGDITPFGFSDFGETPSVPPPAQARPAAPASFQPAADMPAPFNPMDLSGDTPAPFNPFGETAVEPPRARTGAGQSPAPFDPANLDVMPPMGGAGFVQAGPGSLFSLSDVPEPPRSSAARGRGNQPAFPSDLPDVDLQPFDGGLEDIPGLNEPNSFRGTLDSLSDEPFYPQPRPRPRSLEPELEAEPGHEKPLKNFVWMKDRAQKRRDDEEDARDNNAGKSLFGKLAEKRRREAPPPVQEPAARLESFAAEEVDQLGDYMSFDEIERQATQVERPQLPVPSTSVPPPASVLDETPDFNFDFLNSAEAAPPSSRPSETFEPFSLNMDDSEISSPDKLAPFNLEPATSSGTSSAPVSFDLGAEEGAKASAGDLFSFDLDEEESVSTPPFSFGLADEESGVTAPFSFDLGEEAKPTSTSQPPAPFSFDLGEEARPKASPPPPAPFSFDLGTDDSAKASPPPPTPFSFNLGEDSKPKSAPPPAAPFSFDLGTDDSAKASPPTPFSFDLGFDTANVPPPSVSEQRRLEPEPNFDFGKPRPPEPLMPETTPFAFNLDSGTAAEKPAPFSFDLEEAAPPAFLQDLKPDEGFSWNEPGASDKAALPLPDFDFDGSNSPPPGLKQSEAVSSPEIPDFAFESASPTPPTSAEPFAFDLGAIAPSAPSLKRTEPVFDTIDEPTSPPLPKRAEGKPVLPDFDFEVVQPGPPPAFVVEPKSAKAHPVLESVVPTNRAEAGVSGNGSHNDTASYLGRLRQNPRDLEANLQLANTYFEQSKFSEAITHYNSAIRVADPETLTGLVSRLEKIAASQVNPRFHRVLGDAYMKQGQYHWALSEYSKALGTVGAKK